MAKNSIAAELKRRRQDAKARKAERSIGKGNPKAKRDRDVDKSFQGGGNISDYDFGKKYNQRDVKQLKKLGYSDDEIASDIAARDEFIGGQQGRYLKRKGNLQRVARTGQDKVLNEAFKRRKENRKARRAERMAGDVFEGNNIDNSMTTTTTNSNNKTTSNSNNKTTSNSNNKTTSNSNNKTTSNSNNKTNTNSNNKTTTNTREDTAGRDINKVTGDLTGGDKTGNDKVGGDQFQGDVFGANGTKGNENIDVDGNNNLIGTDNTGGNRSGRDMDTIGSGFKGNSNLVGNENVTGNGSAGNDLFAPEGNLASGAGSIGGDNQFRDVGPGSAASLGGNANLGDLTQTQNNQRQGLNFSNNSFGGNAIGNFGSDLSFNYFASPRASIQGGGNEFYDLEEYNPDDGFAGRTAIGAGAMNTFYQGLRFDPFANAAAGQVTGGFTPEDNLRNINQGLNFSNTVGQQFRDEGDQTVSDATRGLINPFAAF